MFELPPDVHMCEIGGTILFLDIRGNRYVRLTDVQSEWLFEVIAANQPEAISGDARRLCSRLVERALLKPGNGAGRPLAPLQHTPPKSSLFDLSLTSSASMASVGRMAAAIADCWWTFRHRQLLPAVRATRQWKSGLPDTAPEDPEPVYASICAFRAIAPYFFTSRDQCLFRSLALAKFLSLEGSRCDWIFGVRLDPFEAHCWIERDGVALNEYTDKAREYRAILCV